MIKMKHPEVTRIINAIGEREITTYDANEFHPKLSTRQMASILKGDKRIINVGKKWLWMGCNHWKQISMWKVAE